MARFPNLWNKQLLTFIFFLALSTSFWIFQVLNEEGEEQFDVALNITDIPDNVVITKEPPRTLQITLHDQVIDLLNYKYARKKIFAVNLSWTDIGTPGGHVRLNVDSVLRPVINVLDKNTEVMGTSPALIDIYYNYGESKRVDVIFQGHLSPDSAYNILATDVEPRQVTVYASRQALDTITGAYLRPLNRAGLKDTTAITAKFQTVNGVKYVPDHVKVNVYADRLVEKTVKVDVRGVNFPANRTLKTFPAKVDVTFLVGASQYDRLDASNFVIVVNYEDLLERTDNVVPLSIKTVPHGAGSPRITPAEVEFLIEEVSAE